MEDYQYLVKIAKRLGIDTGNKTADEIYVDIVAEISSIKGRDLYQKQLNDYKSSVIETLINALNATSKK